MTTLNLTIIEGTLTCEVLKGVDDRSWFKVQTSQGIAIVHVKSKLAEVCNKYLQIGSHVLITGNLVFGDNPHLDAREVKFLPTKGG